MDVRQIFELQIEKISLKFSEKMNGTEKLCTILDEINSRYLKNVQYAKDYNIIDTLFDVVNEKYKASKENIRIKANTLLNTTSRESSTRDSFKKIEENAEQVVVKQEMFPPAQPSKRGRKKKVVAVKKEIVIKKEKIRDSDHILVMSDINTIQLAANNEGANRNVQSKAINNEPQEIGSQKRNTKTVQAEARTTRGARTKQKRQESEEKKCRDQPLVSSVNEDELSPSTTNVNVLASGEVSTASRKINLSTKDEICTPTTEDIHTEPITEMTKTPIGKIITKTKRDSDVIELMPDIDMVDLTTSNEVANPNVEPNAIVLPRKTGTKKQNTQTDQSGARITRATRTKQKRQESEVKELRDEELKSSVYEDVLPLLTNIKAPQTEVVSTTTSTNIHLPSKDEVCTSTEDIYTNPISEMTNAPSSQTIIQTKIIPPLMNETIIIQKAPLVNETIILHKGPASSNNVAINDNILMDNLMTDDESIIDEPNPQKKTGQKQTSKQIFSPYGVSPVKKRVEALEKIANTPPPMRVTRTKTRKLNECETSSNAKDVTQKDAKSKASPVSVSNPVLSSANRFNLKTTPVTQKKTNRIVTPSGNISAKTLSAYKASQDEFREREKQRREREAEALQKKDALRQAQIEEKKRKREEKEQKAKEQREALELAEKQRALELQKQKEEKHRMNLLEKQEKLQKAKEDAERKRLLLKQKREEKEKVIEDKSKPIYMIQKAPFLPTHDCYDSDDDRAPDTRSLRPEWAQRDQIHDKLRTKSYITRSYTNTLFCLKPQTPDLQEIFENIDPKKLIRKSSAVWNHQPRFTRMPKIKEKY